MHDFRRMPGEVSGVESPALRLEIRKALYSRDVAVELSKKLEEESTKLAVEALVTEDAEDIAGRIREQLKVSNEQQSGWSDEGEALRGWRNANEQLGILVFQARHVEPSEMLGFSLAESPFPVLVL